MRSLSKPLPWRDGMWPGSETLLNILHLHSASRQQLGYNSYALWERESKSHRYCSSQTLTKYTYLSLWVMKGSSFLPDASWSELFITGSSSKPHLDEVISPVSYSAGQWYCIASNGRIHQELEIFCEGLFSPLRITDECTVSLIRH